MHTAVCSRSDLDVHILFGAHTHMHTHSRLDTHPHKNMLIRLEKDNLGTNRLDSASRLEGVINVQYTTA